MLYRRLLEFRTSRCGVAVPSQGKAIHGPNRRAGLQPRVRLCGSAATAARVSALEGSDNLARELKARRGRLQCLVRLRGRRNRQECFEGSSLRRSARFARVSSQIRTRLPEHLTGVVSELEGIALAARRSKGERWRTDRVVKDDIGDWVRRGLYGRYLVLHAALLAQEMGRRFVTRMLRATFILPMHKRHYGRKAWGMRHACGIQCSVRLDRYGTVGTSVRLLAFGPSGRRHVHSLVAQGYHHFGVV